MGGGGSKKAENGWTSFVQAPLYSILRMTNRSSYREKRNQENSGLFVTNMTFWCFYASGAVYFFSKCWRIPASYIEWPSAMYEKSTIISMRQLNTSSMCEIYEKSDWRFKISKRLMVLDFYLHSIQISIHYQIVLRISLPNSAFF